MFLGDLLKSGRLKKNLSFQTVVDETGYNVSSLKKYERAGDGGVYPPMDKLARLAALYEIDPREIFSVCADEGVDTKIFYNADNRAQATTALNGILSETSAVLKRYGIKDVLLEEVTVSDGENNLITAHAAIHESIRSIVGTFGIEARRLPKLINGARDELAQIEPCHLIELAEEYFLLPKALDNGLLDSEELADKSLKDLEAWCLGFSELIIVNAIYGIFFWQLDKTSQEQLMRCLNINSTQFFEESTLFAMCNKLNNAIIAREPIMLYDETCFSWNYPLHKLSKKDWNKFFSAQQISQFSGDVVRLYNQFGMIEEINDVQEKTEEASLAADSSVSV